MKLSVAHLISVWSLQSASTTEHVAPKWLTEDATHRGSENERQVLVLSKWRPEKQQGAEWARKRNRKKKNLIILLKIEWPIVGPILYWKS